MPSAISKNTKTGASVHLVSEDNSKIGVNRPTKDDNLANLMPLAALHPTIDFRPEGVSLGFRIAARGINGSEERKLHIASDGRAVQAHMDRKRVILGGVEYLLDEGPIPPRIDGRWDLSRVRQFLADPQERPDLWSLLKLTLETYLELPSVGHVGLLASWVAATYCVHMFPAFPFLIFHGPKESGKSKVLETLEQMSCNAVKLKSVTEAALGDTAQNLRGAILVDQAEALPRRLVGWLADSYKARGAKRHIVRGTSEKRRIVEFCAYGAKAFASTSALDEDLRDRCIQVDMLRTLKPLPDILGNEPVWAEIRDGCYRFLLLGWPEVQRAFQAMPPSGTRAGELWKPIESVLRALDVQAAEIAQVKQAFEDGLAGREDSLTVQEEALVEVLAERAGREGGKFEMSLEEIRGLMGEDLEPKEIPASQVLGKMIRSLSLAEKGRRATRRKHVRYLFESRKVLDVAHRYLGEPTNVAEGVIRRHERAEV